MINFKPILKCVGVVLLFELIALLSYVTIYKSLSHMPILIIRLIYYNAILAMVSFFNTDWQNLKDKSLVHIKYYFVFLSLILFSYLGLVNLCFKLNWTLFPSGYSSALSMVGQVLIFFSILLQLNIIKKYLIKLKMFSFYLSYFSYLIGYTLSFGVWLPFLALPGLLVCLKWYYK